MCLAVCQYNYNVSNTCAYNTIHTFLVLEDNRLGVTYRDSWVSVTTVCLLSLTVKGLKEEAHLMVCVAAVWRHLAVNVRPHLDSQHQVLFLERSGHWLL